MARDREPTAEERIAGLREAIRAARDWQDAAALWSIQNDLDWLLANAEKWSAEAPARDTPRTTDAAVVAFARHVLAAMPACPGCRTDDDFETHALSLAAANGVHWWGRPDPDPLQVTEPDPEPPTRFGWLRWWRGR